MLKPYYPTTIKIHGQFVSPSCRCPVQRSKSSGTQSRSPNERRTRIDLVSHRSRHPSFSCQPASKQAKGYFRHFSRRAPTTHTQKEEKSNRKRWLRCRWHQKSECFRSVNQSCSPPLIKHVHQREEAGTFPSKVNPRFFCLCLNLS